MVFLPLTHACPATLRFPHASVCRTYPGQSTKLNSAKSGRAVHAFGTTPKAGMGYHW